MLCIFSLFKGGKRDRQVGDNALGHADGAPAYKSQRPNTRMDQVSHHVKKRQYTKTTTTST